MAGDHTDNALRAAVKALDDVIRPALDPSNALAVEQAKLVSAYLRLCLERLPYLYDRNRFEVGHYLEMAEALVGRVANAPERVIQALDDAIEAGRAVLTRPGARIPELQEAAEHLAAAISALVRLVDGDADAQAMVEKTVLQLSRSYIDAQRSWFLPQGWEPDPSAVPDIGQALHLPPHKASAAR